MDAKWGRSFSHHSIFWVNFNKFFCYNIFFRQRTYILEIDHMGLDGQTGFLNSTGTMMFSIVVVISNLKMLIFSKTHYNFTIFFIFGSIGVYLLTWYIFNLFIALDAYQTFPILHSSAYYYLVMWEIIGFTMGTDLMIWRYLGFFKNMFKKLWIYIIIY